MFKKCAAALHNFSPATLAQQLAKQRLEIPTYVFIIQAWDPADAPVFVPRLAALKGSQPANENIELMADIFMMTEWYPEFFSRIRTGIKTNDGYQTPEESLFGQLAYKWVRIWVDAAQAEQTGSNLRNRYMSLAFCFNVGYSFLDLLTECVPRHETLELFDWDKSYGKGGSLLIEATLIYDL